MMIVYFTMTIEFSGAKERIPWLPWVTWSAFLANIIGVPCSLGEAVTPLFAIVLTDWVEFQASLSAVILGRGTITVASINPFYGDLSDHQNQHLDHENIIYPQPW